MVTNMPRYFLYFCLICSWQSVLIFFFKWALPVFLPPSSFPVASLFTRATSSQALFFFFFLAKILGNTCSTSLVFLNLAFKVRFGNLTQPQKGAEPLEKNLSCRTIICSLLFFVIIKNDQCITLVSEDRKLL